MSCGECESTELMPSKQPDPADVAQSSPKFSLDSALTPPTLLETAKLRQQSRNASQPCIVGKRSTVPILRAWPGNRNASGLLSPERPTKRRRSRHPIRCREPARQTPTEHRQ